MRKTRRGLGTASPRGGVAPPPPAHKSSAMAIDTSGLLCYLHRDEPQHEKAVQLVHDAGSKRYSAESSLALFMPITKQQKGYPLEALLPPELQIHGVILADQIKCLDWKARGVQFFESVPESVLEEVQAKLEPLIP